MLEAIEKVLLEEKPDWVLVHGDTNSTLAGALAAVKLHIPVAHVEAGLRSFNRHMPEEINRVLTDHASDLLFAPTKTAVINLRHEGIPEERIKLVGDVMFDSALFYGKRAERQSQILNKLDLKPKGYVLATVHRAENTDDPVRLKVIFDALCEIAGEIKVVLPLHPRTREALIKSGMHDKVASGICLTEPVGYLDMVMLEKTPASSPQIPAACKRGVFLPRALRYLAGGDGMGGIGRAGVELSCSPHIKKSYYSSYSLQLSNS